jgi:hypothetical protein
MYIGYCEVNCEAIAYAGVHGFIWACIIPSSVVVNMVKKLPQMVGRYFIQPTSW